MDASPSIASLMPDLLKIPRPTATGSNPMIISAEMLEVKQTPILPFVPWLQPKIDPSTKIKMYAAFAGFSVLNAILKTDPKDYMKLLWRPSQDFSVWIGSVEYIDTLDDLLKVFDLTKFGDARVEGSEDIPALATFQDVISLYRNNVLKSTLRVQEIGSEMVEISPETYLMDVIALMFQKRMRRVFLTGTEKKNSIFPFISSRDIIRFLFSPSRLEVAKKDPESWSDAKLSEIGATEAKVIHDGDVVNQAAREIGDGADDCLICEDSKRVVTRWDIVMKPWKADNYSFGEKSGKDRSNA